jgi:membrane-associated phospholipid phosphatase
MTSRTRYSLMAGATGLLATYLVLAVAAAQQQFLPVDRGLRAWVQPLRSGWLDATMQTISFLGEPAGLIPLILVASALLWRASRHWALLLPGLMAGTGLLQLAGKWAADRPRPNAAPWGFPSGHVLSLAVFFGVVAFLLLTLSDRRRRWRLLGCHACGVAVGLVAASRIYLDMHWLSDVIGGFTLGVGYLLLALCATPRLTARPSDALPADLVVRAPASPAQPA